LTHASFYIPLTGLTSDSTALNTIANDLANMNTTGFKSQSVNFFRSLLSADRFNRIGRSDPAGIGYAGRVDRNGFLDRISQFNRR
jgi:flagellar hook protein FlgE